jgi:hypothetical protein
MSDLAIDVLPAIGEDPSTESEAGDDEGGGAFVSYSIGLFLEAVSAAVATEGILSVYAERAERPSGIEARISQAFDVDLRVSLDEARKLRFANHIALVRLLKSWTKKSGESRRVLMDHVLDATLDPLTWRVALEDVGPRPHVSIALFVPGSFAHGAETKPLHDVDIAVVYRGAPRAAEEIDDLATAMAPEIALPTPPVVLQARRNAEARTALLSEFGALTAAQVAELAGSDAKNTSALAGRWRREGRLVAVEHHGTVYYPGFQFDSDGRPKPTVGQVLHHLSDPSMTPWQQALWFTTANGWLGGRRPVDLLDDEGDAVVAAAGEALREPVG